MKKKLLIFAGVIVIPALIFILIWFFESRRVIIFEIVAENTVLKGDGQSKTMLTLSVADPSGKPLSGHIVELLVHGQGALSQRRIKTDESGRAQLYYQSYRVTSFNPAGEVRIEAVDISVGRILEIRERAEVIIKVE